MAKKFKTAQLFFVIFILGFILTSFFNPVKAASISKNIFPKSVNQLIDENMVPVVLKEVKSEKEKGIKKGYVAEYANSETDIYIWVHIWQMKDKKTAEETVENWIPNKKKEVEKSWEKNKKKLEGVFVAPKWCNEMAGWPVRGHWVKATCYHQRNTINCNPMHGTCDHLNHTEILTNVDEYFFLVEMNLVSRFHPSKANEEAKRDVNDVQAVLDYFLSQHPNYPGGGSFQEKEKSSFLKKFFNSITNVFKKKEKKVKEVDKPKATTKPKSTPKAKKASPSPSPKAKEKKAVCGNMLCDMTLGEDCQNCPQDCLRFSGYCCDVKSQGFLYAHDYQQEKFSLREAGGAIPPEAISVPKEATKDNFFNKYTAFICEGGTMVAGECVSNVNCYQGYCQEHHCVKAVSKEVKEVKPKKAARQIIDKQEATRKAFTQAYLNVRDGVSTVGQVIQALDIKMLVQGDLVGKKVLEVVEGNEVEVVLEIENTTDDYVGIVPGIIYPGFEAGAFDLEELEYTMGYNWSYKGVLSWGSLIGSHMTHRLGGKVIVLYPDSKFRVYSKIVPRQTGYLDIESNVYVSSAKRFKEVIPDLQRWNKMPTGDLWIIDQKEVLKRDTDKFEEIFDLSEGSATVLVKEKPCRWWFCL